MMGEFQTWPQISNRIAFDPLFGKIKLENWLLQNFVNFRVFLGQNGVKFMQFEFYGQIWKPPIILDILGL